MSPVVQSQVGQAIVLESWTARESEIHIPDWSTPNDEVWELATTYEVDDTAGTIPLVNRDGKTYYAAEKSGLFMMLKADENNPHEMEHAMNGWIFATTTPDGGTINELGKVQNCVDCHQHAPHRGGLFGLFEFVE